MFLKEIQDFPIASGGIIGNINVVGVFNEPKGQSLHLRMIVFVVVVVGNRCPITLKAYKKVGSLLYVVFFIVFFEI